MRGMGEGRLEGRVRQLKGKRARMGWRESIGGGRKG